MVRLGHPWALVAASRGPPLCTDIRNASNHFDSLFFMFANLPASWQHGLKQLNGGSLMDTGQFQCNAAYNQQELDFWGKKCIFSWQ